MFSDNEFEVVLKEFEDPDLSQYEFFLETMDVTIYRKFIQSSGLYEYKVLGNIGCHGSVCQEVYMDLDYRKSWDSYVAELKEVQTDDTFVIYWDVKYPFPLSNRDYCYVRKLRHFVHNGKDTWIILSRSYKVESIPVKKRAIRVEDYHQYMVIQDDGFKNTKAYMHYYDNPKGMIPTWFINWAAKTGIPSFLMSMKLACESYEQHKTERSKAAKKS
ncbi:phosphatidylcholine transfer protein-like [Rhopilema esculentum]|uniref:phosphatidylcholine transfer protein-like n=1 Tax=Rhopilema esculentum TaxID=499914 RepID=UPI0031D7D4CD